MDTTIHIPLGDGQRTLCGAATTPETLDFDLTADEYLNCYTNGIPLDKGQHYCPNYARHAGEPDMDNLRNAG